jgi:hypothetical protein
MGDKMTSQATDARDELESVAHEGMKVFRVKDGSNRIIEQYECAGSVPANGPCLKTIYVYDDATTSPTKMKEIIGVWLEAYEV